MKKIKKFFDREQNLLIHFTITILVAICGFVFHIASLEWVLIICMITFVITSELINSAIELTVETYTKDFHPLAMVAKDTAAGAVLISALTSIVVGLYIFLPKIVLLFK